MPHIHELYDFTVGLFIVHNDKILLINHPKYGKWMAPGGHIELNEDPIETVYREAEEETGLKVRFAYGPSLPSEDGYKTLPIPQFFEVHEANPPHKHISFGYVLLSDSDKSVMSSEHTEMRWFTANEIQSDQQLNVTNHQRKEFLLAIELAKKATGDSSPHTIADSTTSTFLNSQPLSS